MKIILRESQVLVAEGKFEDIGCNQFPQKSESREWCNNAFKKLNERGSHWLRQRIQSQINKVADYLKNDSDVSYNEKVKYYMSGDTFFDENVRNLNILEELLSENCEKTKDTIKEFKEVLAQKFLFVEKVGQEFKYSKLNKLNTNFSALCYLLTNFRDRKRLVGKPFGEVFEEYFEQPKDSVKESPFFNLLVEYFSNRSEAIEIMNGALKTIKGTEDIGLKSEIDAYNLLVETFGEENVKLFSGDNSWPDFLGVDMLVNEHEFGWGWIPVQVKTDILRCRSNDRFCKNVCLGKNKTLGNKWEIKIYDGNREIHPSEL
jgi:hypothetical protein